MFVSSVETLIVFLGIFGIIGAVRGPGREVWTLCGVVLTAILLLFGGVPILQQLPLRLAAALLTLTGNQTGSTDLVAHPLGAPWTNIMLWLVVLGLLAVSYLIGQRFGAAKSESFLSTIVGFAMGALNGLVIAVFIFQNGLAPLNVQFPDGLMTRNGLAPFIFVIAGIALIALVVRPPGKAAAKS